MKNDPYLSSIRVNTKTLGNTTTSDDQHWGDTNVSGCFFYVLFCFFFWILIGGTVWMFSGVSLLEILSAGFPAMSITILFFSPAICLSAGVLIIMVAYLILKSIVMYWIIRKDVHHFIDIKEKAENGEEEFFSRDSQSSR